MATTERKPNEAAVIAEKVAVDARVELFHDADQEGWARVEVRPGVHEHFPLTSRKFWRWLNYATFTEDGRVVSEGTFKNVALGLEGIAVNEGDLHPVHLRVAHVGGSTFLDLADADRTVIEVAPKGWRVVEGEPPVRFQRTHGMRPLPMPKPTKAKPGDLLKPYVNVTKGDMVIVTTLATNRLSGIGPYPLLGIHGEHGTAKTTQAKLARDMADPSKAEVRSLPTEERDLLVAAANGHVLAYGNVSELPQWLSDAFCRLATGAGFSKRMLYTDTEEVVMAAMRPVILEGIPEVEVAPDLADRTVTINLQRITEYVAEKAFWARFEGDHPEVLGSLLNAVSVGLGNLDSVSIKSEFRMADFARWAEGVAPAVGVGFFDLYREQREESAAAALEDCPFYEQLSSAIYHAGGSIREEPSKLFSLVEARLPDGEPKPKDWPRRSNEFGEQLRRIAPALRSEGIGFEPGKSNGRRVVRVWFMSPEERMAGSKATGTTGTTDPEEEFDA